MNDFLKEIAGKSYEKILNSEIKYQKSIDQLFKEDPVYYFNFTNQSVRRTLKSKLTILDYGFNKKYKLGVALISMFNPLDYTEKY